MSRHRFDPDLPHRFDVDPPSEYAVSNNTTFRVPQAPVSSWQLCTCGAMHFGERSTLCKECRK